MMPRLKVIALPLQALFRWHKTHYFDSQQFSEQFDVYKLSYIIIVYIMLRLG